MQFLPHQTDGAAACGAVDVAAQGIATTPATFDLVRVRPYGATPVTVILAPSTTVGSVFFQTNPLGSGGLGNIGEPGIVIWPAGTYVVRVNVAAGNANIRFREVYLHAISPPAGCGGVGTGLGFVGSLTGLSTLASLGVKTFNVVVASDFAAAENANLYVTVVLSNSSALMNQQIQITPNQVLTTPILVPGPMSAVGVGR